MSAPDIFSYIKQEESHFETQKIRIGDNWEWNFRDHVQLIFHLKNGMFYTGQNDWLRAFKNVMEPLLNLAYWTEDLEVKDVTFFIEMERGRALSFLIKKYHDEKYAREHDLDELFDEITENDCDYGGELTQRTSGHRPESIPLNSIAFCDQTDILGGPLGIKYHFSPAGLRKMEKKGWGSESNGATITLDDLVTLADYEKDPDGMEDTKTNRTTGKTIEVYIVRGSLPEHYLKDNDNMEDWYNQVHVVAFYTDRKGKKEGVTLYRKKEKEGALKFHTSKKVHNRALGRGIGEALLHPQIWTNFLTIHKMNLLESASKVPLYTDDPNYANANKIQDMENLEITTVEEGRQIRQVPTAAPANLQLIATSIDDWFQQAQLDASAQDPILGKEPNSGTTFRGQERTVAQGRGFHDRRRGKRAKYIEEIYRDWIIPDIVKEIVDGKEFMATLTADELSWVSDQLAVNYADKKLKDRTLNFKEGDEPPTKAEREMLMKTFKDSFRKKGEKHLLKILKDEFEDIEVKVGINVANKQKDLANLSDKLLSIFQYVFANPQGFQQAMQIPALAKSFKDILEYSGLNQADFLTLTQPPEPEAQSMLAPAQQQGGGGQQPLALNQQQPVEA